MKTEWGEVVSYWTSLQCETEEPMYMRSRSQGTLVKSHKWWCHVAASWGGEERWEVEVLWLCLTEQGHFPYQWIPPALSLPPDGSRTQLLAVSLRQRDFRPFPCKLAGTKQGFNFRKGSSLLLQAFFFSPEDWKWFQGLGQSSSTSNSYSAGKQKATTYLQWQLSHLLPSEGSQKYPAEKLTFWFILHSCMYLYKVWRRYMILTEFS